MYYLRSRYYRPDWGRFISADSLINENLYGYCSNNPMSYTDFTGHEYVSTLDEMNAILRDYWIHNDGIPVSVFKDRIKKRRKVPPNYCATLIDSALKQKNERGVGMSTMFREKSVVCGRIDIIGLSNLPIGTTLGKMPGLGEDDFDPDNIYSYSRYSVKHGGVIVDKRYENGECYITLRQAATIGGKGKIKECEYTASELKEAGWNVFMWDKRMRPDGYEWMVNRDEE